MGQLRTKVTLRTRRTIKDAVIRLLSEQDSQSITISQIAREADINRGTVYSHYSTVRDVIDDIVSECINPFFVIVEQINITTFFKKPEIFISEITKIISEKFETYKGLIKMVGIESFLFSLGNQIFDSMTSNLDLKKTSSKKTLFEIQFVLAGAITTYYTWLLSHTGEISNDEIVALVSNIIKKIGEERGK